MGHVFKNSCILIVTFVLLGGCASVKKYNSQLDALKSETKLKADVDYLYRRLQKLHPKLYWYISKKDLDYKFDSLKATINAPMTSNDFFFKLSPVISSIKQGHMRMYPLSKRLTKKEFSVLRKKGDSPLSQLTYEVFNNRLYIVKNSSSDTSIKVGSEVVSVNGIKPQDVFSTFKNTFASDGFNHTFFSRVYGWQFSNFFYVYSGERDSIVYQLRYNDTLTNVFLKRGKSNVAKEERVIADKTKEEMKRAKKESKKEIGKRNLQGYNSQTRTYSKNLSLMGPDSSIALMKINDFSRGKYRKFYRNSFKKLDSLKTKALILDLRDNPGGKLNEIGNLYSYLTDSSFYLIDKMEVTSRTSFVLGGYSRSTPIVVKALSFTIGLPFLAGRIARVKKEKSKYYFMLSESKLKRPNTYRFNGKVYVLINGGSFSASSIISSDLKGSKRATFVGEETGGAYNGCIAGRMPVFTLPESKLKMHFGLGLIQPHYRAELDGRGVLPDVAILTTIEDRIKKNDPELRWVLDDIKGQHQSEPKSE